nr:hypothetical protein HRS07_25435 [Escherichia coli]
MQPMLQPHHVPPAVSRTGRVVGSVSVFQRRNGIDKAREAAKVLLLQSHQKRGSYQRQCRETSETNAAASQNRQPLLHPQRPRRLRSCHLGTGCGGLKEAAKSSERMHHQVPVVQLPRQRRQEIPRRRQNVRDER